MIYGQDDIAAEPYYEGSNVCGYRIYPDEEYPPPVACDYSIDYTCDHNDRMESISFYMKDHVVIAIEQSSFDGD
jgi:hypothetical protein